MPETQDTKAATTMTREDLIQLIGETATKALGPAVEAALGPLTKAQEKNLELFGQMFEREKKQPNKGWYPDEPGLKFGRYARALALGKGDPERAVREIKNVWGADDDDPAMPMLKASYEVRKTALVANNAGQAGNMVRPDWAAELIPLLRNAAFFRQIPGVRIIPMPTGSITYRKQTGAATAYYIGEGEKGSNSRQTVALQTMSAKKLFAGTPISNDLLRYGGPEVDAMVRDDLIAASALKEDLCFVSGNAAGAAPKEPTGAFYQMTASNGFTSGGVTLALLEPDLNKCIRLLLEANIPVTPENCAWAISPYLATSLKTLAAATDTGFRPFKDGLEQNPPRLLGYRAFVTNQVVATATAVHNAYFFHGPSFMIGDTLQTQLDAFPGGAYYDSDSAAVVSGISQDETYIRLLREHDLGMRYADGAAAIKAITVS